MDEILEGGDDMPIEPMSVFCAECHGDQVRCYMCMEYPECCFCAEDEVWYSIWCERCEKGVNPEGSSVLVRDDGYSWDRHPVDISYDFNHEPHEGEELPDDWGKKCYCYPEEEYWCDVCNVVRDSPNDEWESLSSPRDPNVAEGNNVGKKKGKRKKKQQKQKQKPHQHQNQKSTAANSSNYYSGGFGAGGYTGLADRHYGQPVDINGLTVYASSSWNIRKDDDFKPDWGLYADWCWRPGSWRAEHIAWPDMDIPVDKILAFEQILEATEKAQAGQLVEFGCVGGHGRTGTILAIVGVIMGMSAEEAIVHIKSAYCPHAIETDSQEWFVEWVDSQLNGTPLRDEPVGWGYSTYYGKSTGVTTGVTTKMTTCTMRDHWDMWLEGNKECTRHKERCSFWKNDCTKFMNGVTPDNVYTTGNKSPSPTPLNKTYIVDGSYAVTGAGKFRVPEPPYKHPRHHNEAKNCACDVCRYLRAGHGAFLQPADKEESAKWCQVMDELDIRYSKVVAARRINQNKAKNDNKIVDEKIMMVGSDGVSLIETPIAKNFSPLPPKSTGITEIGSRSGEYIYLGPAVGWVWERLAAYNGPILT